MMPMSALSPFSASCASASRSDLNWWTFNPFSSAAARSGSALAPGFSGAQNTPATSSLRARNASSTALPKSCCPMIAILISCSLRFRSSGFLGRRRERPRALQLGDLFLAVAEHFLQDFLRVLAQRRRALDDGLRRGQLDRHADVP